MNKQIYKLKKIISNDIKWLINTYEIPWSILSNKNILITGASGFLAAFMLETLLFVNDKMKLGVFIIALVRDKKYFLNRIQFYANRQDLICLEQDVLDIVHLNKKIHFIIHAASQASPKFFLTDPVGTLLANTTGTSQLLELARKDSSNGFLFISSAEVYGNANIVPTKEVDYGYCDPLEIRSCYSESKRMGENMCVSWFHQYGVPTTIVRPFHTYGPGMKLDDGRIYADIVSSICKGENIVLMSDGKATRSFCYIADATAAFWLVLLRGEKGSAYNVGDPDNEISINDLAYKVSKLYPSRNIKIVHNDRSVSDNYSESKISRTCPDITKIKSLGWFPHTSIESGFIKSIDSYEYS